MTRRIPQEFINQVLARTDIIELIQARIKLTKRGQNHQGLCPFHQEKSPSFSANQTKQFFYCFGCGASGNAIGFVMQYDHFDFRQAVEYLANQLGLELPDDENGEKNQEIKQLHEIMQRANVFFQQQLRQSEPAKHYLISRGLSGQIAKTFNIGFVPEGWRQLAEHLPQPEQHRRLHQTGMLKEKNGRAYDTFRHRIMFPIRNVRGQVVGFGGRSIDNSPPKYLNSPETILFHKNDELFGLYEAKVANAKLDRLLVTEGYMDVVSLHQYGVTHAVATLGTAINKQHLQKLLRYTNHIIFCFDGDKAGKKATWKALLASLTLAKDGTLFQFFNANDGEDPDSLIRSIGKQEFLEQVSNSPELTEVMFNELKSQHPTENVAGKASFAKAAMSLIDTIPAGIFKQLVTDKLANEIEIAPSHIESQQTPPPPRIDTTPKTSHSFKIKYPLSPALFLAAILIQQPNQLSTLPEELPLSSSNPEHQWLFEITKLIKTHSINETRHFFDLAPAELHTPLAELAHFTITVPEDGLTSEVEGALRRLTEQQSEVILSTLIKKSRTSALSESEKAQIKSILHLKNKKLLDPDSA